uniref:BZIP domain-containing protein n=1 Tax=Dendroctonus ponderosae TaxID=77166 RepID=A0AAR5PYM2_DENPD
MFFSVLENNFKAFREVPSENTKEDKSDNLSLFPSRENERSFRHLIPKQIFSQNNNLLPYRPLELLHRDSVAARLSLDSAVSPTLSNGNLRKQRSEKRPIPEEQKDDKYFERRRRNNQAAKKSRDARKIREDQIALKATILEHENALLRAQVVTLREEASSLRQMLLQRKPFDHLPPTSHSPLCVITQ